MHDILTRNIRQADNAAIAAIIRGAHEEFDAVRPGTVYFDKTTADLYSLFNATPASVYFVAEKEGAVVGGAGIMRMSGLPKDTCELVKMYLLPEVRGIGLGKKLISRCISFAKETGYQNIYLESLPELKQALKTYEKFGFSYLDSPMGDTGHTGCTLWMLMKLAD